MAMLKADQAEFYQGLEAIHCHKCTCHASMGVISKTKDNDILEGIPFSTKHITQMNIISNGKCPCCMAAKSMKVSTNPHRKTTIKTLFPDKNLPDERFCWQPDDNALAETLGLDIFYIWQAIFVISREA